MLTAAQIARLLAPRDRWDVSYPWGGRPERCVPTGRLLELAADERHVAVARHITTGERLSLRAGVWTRRP